MEGRADLVRWSPESLKIRGSPLLVLKKQKAMLWTAYGEGQPIVAKSLSPKITKLNSANNLTDLRKKSWFPDEDEA